MASEKEEKANRRKKLFKDAGWLIGLTILLIIMLAFLLYFGMLRA